MKKFFALLFCAAALGACSSDNGGGEVYYQATPTVDYVERLDVNSAPQRDSFLNQLAVNYRSYAIYNARQSGHPDIGEIFAQKAVAAFSGETPFPEAIENWKIADQNLGFELSRACQELIDMLKKDMADYCPVEMAEAQAKYDCWLTASASGQTSTASECRARFLRVMEILRRGGPNGCGTKIPAPAAVSPAPEIVQVQPEPETEIVYYPEPVAPMPAQMRARESVLIVNNVNIPANLIKPEPVKPVQPAQPVQPIVFNQNIYGGDKSISNSGDGFEEMEVMEEIDDVAMIQAGGDDMVSRQEFVEMMLSMREEIRAINARLDNAQRAERAVLKVQQIPLEPQQHVMEEVFEVYFDFNKSQIKPEYEDVIRKLVQATQENRNVKISVVGHTDTVGSDDYNYALGGRRAESVRKMLIKYGIPADQIVTVSSGKQDLKVPTGDQVRNPKNRRVRVIKEQSYIEPPPQSHINALVEGEFEIVEE